MKVLILAAGRSKRMKPIEDKNFLEFVGKPLIVHQLEMIKECGFKDIILVGGAHNLDRLKQAAMSVNLNVEIVEQKDLEMGMCGAVLSAKKYLNGPVLVFSSNDVVESKAFKLIKSSSEKNNAESYILAKKVNEYFPGGYLKIDKNGLIQGIIEKPKKGTEPSALVNLVVHYHKDSAKLISYLEKSKSDHDDVYETALDKMISDGIKMKAVPYDGFWQPIKYPWHVMKVFKYFFNKAKKKVSKSAKISKKATVNGEVIIEDNVKIFDGAVVNGPVYLGEGSVIATNALVRESSIGKNCVVGFSTEIARSFLGNEVWTHSNYIGDSVIGNNVSFGAGTVTGNLRLDEKNIFVQRNGDKIDTGTNKFGLVTGDNIRFGINVSLMPGVSIGSGSFVGAGLIIAENIPEKSFVKGKTQLEITENKVDVRTLSRENLKKKL